MNETNHKKKVLVVDDEVSVLRFLKHSLEASDFDAMKFPSKNKNYLFLNIFAGTKWGKNLNRFLQRF